VTRLGGRHLRRRTAFGLLGLAGAALTAMGLRGAPEAHAQQPAPAPATRLAPLVWKAATSSPAPAQPADARNKVLLAACGNPDAALAAVASRNVDRQIAGLGLFPSDELAFTLRAAGDPHVWPRAWSVSGPALAEDDLLRRVKTWAGNWRAQGTRRCGLARGVAADGTHVTAAIAVDVLADMAPLPTTARVGQWLTLEGTMLVPTTAAKVVLLGPRGAPRTVIASLSGNKVRSSFAVDQPGAWLVQVLATVSTGPRPVLEAMVFAGTAPPAAFVRAAAPGEAAAAGASDDDEAMRRMINAARAAEQLPPLVRDVELDKLAMVHSEEMRRTKVVGHDVGGGDPRARIEAAGIKARIAGENVASASTLEGAHRALWSSPSHRGNLLGDRWTRVGVAVVRGTDGFVWVTELFAG
jgi:uncharacterized protein YkwD